jgi:hypothetical protein
MRGRTSIILVLMSALAVSAGCLFKQQPFKGVVSYRDGRVYLRPSRSYAGSTKFYRVGLLPEGWERIETRARTISFYSADLGASISTDAYCGRSVDDRSLASLGGDLITALEGRKVADEREFMLADRGALRQLVTGTVDGVPTDVDLVVVRKDGCVFDFYLVTQGGAPAGAVAAFEAFFGGFAYE